jgi:hypothetical protein
LVSLFCLILFVSNQNFGVPNVTKDYA